MSIADKVPPSLRFDKGKTIENPRQLSPMPYQDASPTKIGFF